MRHVRSALLMASQQLSSAVQWSTAQKAVQRLVPPLSFDSRKGQNGRIGVLGGSYEYTGAPYYAAQSALQAGADVDAQISRGPYVGFMPAHAAVDLEHWGVLLALTHENPTSPRLHHLRLRLDCCRGGDLVELELTGAGLDLLGGTALPELVAAVEQEDQADDADDGSDDGSDDEDLKPQRKDGSPPPGR